MKIDWSLRLAPVLIVTAFAAGSAGGYRRDRTTISGLPTLATSSGAAFLTWRRAESRTPRDFPSSA